MELLPKDQTYRDRSSIWLMREDEIRYWTSELGVTIYALRDAIAATGTRAASVIRSYLHQTGLT